MNCKFLHTLAEVSAAEKRRAEIERSLREAEAALGRIRDLSAAVDAAEKAWTHGCQEVRLTRQELSHRQEEAERVASAADEARTRLTHAKDQLESVRLRMKSEGVSAALEGRIKSVENRVRDLESKIEFVLQKRGEATNRLQVVDASIVASRERQRKAEADRAAAERMLPDVGALSSERLGERGGTAEALLAFVEEMKRREAEVETTLKRDICEPIGFDYAFQFDAAACSLVDQRGEAIDAVLENENAQYEAQKTVITERTQRLFRDIFVSEVLRKLYEDDQRLTQLSVKINRMLKDRYFGSSRYSFGLKPVAEYESLLSLIRKYSAFGAGEDGEEISDFVTSLSWNIFKIKFIFK